MDGGAVLERSMRKSSTSPRGGSGAACYATQRSIERLKDNGLQ